MDNCTNDASGVGRCTELRNNASLRECLASFKVLNNSLQITLPTSSHHLAKIALLFSTMVQEKCNEFSDEVLWVGALNCLKNGLYHEGKELLFDTCLSSLDSESSQSFYTASKNYEKASHIMISKQVETANSMARMLFHGEFCKALSIGQVVEVSCPARLDLSGGWTDTPPICYEYGGAVTNVAIKVNGQKPLGCKASFIKAPIIQCDLIDMDGAKSILQWTHLDDLKDYDNPLSSGALIKASVVYSGLIDLKSKDTLERQLIDRYNGGVDISVWSYLAHGSGLGGSSILAGAILAALSVLLGQKQPSIEALVHAVLGVEQLLTSAGGWQDTVGGLFGGFKLGISRDKIPLVVESFTIPTSNEFVQFINERLVIIYTGKVRLARGLLQNVIRNWHSRQETIVQCFTELRRLALKAADAIVEEDAAQLGECVTNYWNLKNKVAACQDSEEVNKLRSTLNPIVLGQCFAGAGGGGYLYALTKTPLNDTSFRELKEIVAQFEGMNLDRAEVDVGGISINVDGVDLKPTFGSVRNVNKSDWEDFWDN